MEVALQVIWWLGLLGALAFTVVLLKQVSLLLRVLRQIHLLATYVGEAAQGLAAHSEAVDAIGPAAATAARFGTSAGELEKACSSVRTRLEQVAEKRH